MISWHEFITRGSYNPIVPILGRRRLLRRLDIEQVGFFGQRDHNDNARRGRK